MKIRQISFLSIFCGFLGATLSLQASAANVVGSDFSVKLIADQMFLANTQYYPVTVSLEQVRRALTSTELPVVFSRSVKVNKVERIKLNSNTDEVVTSGEKTLFGIDFDVVSVVTCVEVPIQDGWQENCTLNINKGDSKKILISAYSESKCVGRNAPVCSLTANARFKTIRFPISAHAKQLATAAAIETLHGFGSTLTYVVNTGVSPYQARAIYEGSALFATIQKMVPLFQEAAAGKLNSNTVFVTGSDRPDRFNVVRN